MIFHTKRKYGETYYIHGHFNTFIVNFYAGQLLAPAEGFGQGKKINMLFWPILGNFFMISSNLSNFNK